MAFGPNYQPIKCAVLHDREISGAGIHVHDLETRNALIGGEFLHIRALLPRLLNVSSASKAPVSASSAIIRRTVHISSVSSLAMASSTAVSIPRFLLPQNGAIWRQLRPSALGQSRSGMNHQVRSRGTRRNASTSSGSGSGSKAQKPIVLEKPLKFNPPSHGARLPKKGARPHQQHYGGDMSAAELAAQKVKEYPGTLPAEGTAAKWIWNSRGFHLTITLVCCLAAYLVFRQSW